MAGITAKDLGRRLFDACDEGELETIKRLLENKEAGSIVNKKYENDETPLFRAAKKGHTKIVDTLLQHEAADVDSINGDEGSTPLIAAAENDWEETVKLLVKHNANVNIQKRSGPQRGWSALMCVSTKGQEKIEIAKILLKHGAMIDLEGDMDPFSLQFINEIIIENGGHQCTWTALMIACYTGKESILQLLVEHGADVNKQNDKGLSPLMFAVLNGTDDSEVLKGYTSIAHALLERGARVDLRTRNRGLSVLMIASRLSKTDAVKLLLEHGAYVNAQSSIGWSALMFANENSHEETALALKNYGGKVYYNIMQPDNDIDSETKKWLELVIACDNGCTEKVIQLLKEGVDVNMTDEDDGWSLLMIVSRSGYPELAKVLLEHGADVNFKNTMGLSALMFATQNGQTETIKVLCSYGANMNEFYSYMCYSETPNIRDLSMLLGQRFSREETKFAKGKDGHTKLFKPLSKHEAGIKLQENKPLLFLAVENGNAETVELLLKLGADIKAQDSNGNSALFVAVKNGDTITIHLLLDYGADINMQNNDLWSPLMWASHRGYAEVSLATLLDSYSEENIIPFGNLSITQNFKTIATIDILLKHGANMNMKNNKGMSPLMLACQNKDIQITKKLLENGADTNMQNNDGFSALMIASKREQLQIAVLLLKHGANVNIQNNEGMSALMLASDKEATDFMKLLVKHGACTELRTFNHGLSALMIASSKEDTRAVCMLLENGANVNAQSSDGWTALMFAKENGHEGIAQILKDYGGKVYCIQPLADNDSETKKWLELVIACENSHTKEVDHLLKQGVNVNLIPPNHELSALMVVSQSGNLQMTKLLLELGANVDLKNRKGWSTLMFASQSGQVEIVCLLLDYGADVNLQSDDGTSALMVSYLPKLSELFLDRGANINLKNNNGAAAIFAAVQKGFTKIVEFLLEHGADVNDRDNEGTSILMVAVKNGSIETVMVFLDYGVDINSQNKNMWSALMFSCQKGHTQMTKLLLEYGADVNLQKGNGWTALMLMIAGTNANFEIANLLLKYGADINIQGSDGRSALMLACQNAYSEIAKLLVEWGADVNMQNTFSGMSALMFASQHENEKTVELLLNHGADVCLKDNNGFSALKFANKKVPKIVQLLTECEAVSMKYGPTTLLIEDLIAETTIEVTSHEQHFSWHEYGLQLDIPENSLPEDIHTCTICIKASITGGYQLPHNLHLVSAVYTIKCIPKIQFSKLVTLRIQHCVTQQESLHKLCFVRSPSADSSFELFQSNTDSDSQSAAVDCFPKHSSYGFIELDRLNFCKFALAGFGERDYRANTYHHEDDARHHKIYFVILWNTDAHNKLVTDYYLNENAVLHNDQRIIFKENQIKLDVPFPSSVGIPTKNGWRILTLTPPMITKREIDRFKKGKRIPSCLLLAECVGEAVSDLVHPVKLKGTRDPYDNLIIRVYATGRDSDLPIKFDEPPKLDELLVLKYTDKGTNKKVRVISEARHKWKDIAGRICRDPNEIAVVQQACLADQNDCLMKLFIDHFINKKPQNYSQSWSGIIELLGDVELEILAEKVKCALKCMWKLPGVEECGETSVIVHSSQGQLVEWNGLKLHIHTGCLPEGLQQCTIFIKASLAGDYEIPENTSLVSGIFWLRCEPQCTFIKPITVEIQHCSTKRDLSKLNIVRAFCSQKSFPYKFKRLKGGSFNADTFYGAIDLKGFSGIGVIEENPDSERMYYNQLFYRSLSHQQRHEIHIAFVWNTELHLNHIKQQYPEDNFLAGHPRVVEVEGEIIKVMLDAAEWTKVMNDQWEILPVQPMVIKAALDDFKPGRWLPSCVLEARPLCEDFPQLVHQIILNGIKPPQHKVILSYMPPRIINRGSGMLSSAEAPLAYPTHRMLTSSATGRDSDLPTKFDEPPKLDELLVLKYTDKGENKKVRVISEARHKWKDIAGRICRDPNEIAVVQQACLTDQNECLMKLFIDNFINKKPQNYSQDWNGIIELLDDVELETLAEKVKYALRCM